MNDKGFNDAVIHFGENSKNPNMYSIESLKLQEEKIRPLFLRYQKIRDSIGTLDELKSNYKKLVRAVVDVVVSDQYANATYEMISEVFGEAWWHNENKIKRHPFAGSVIKGDTTLERLIGDFAYIARNLRGDIETKEIKHKLKCLRTPGAFEPTMFELILYARLKDSGFICTYNFKTRNKLKDVEVCACKEGIAFLVEAKMRRPEINSTPGKVLQKTEIGDLKIEVSESIGKPERIKRPLERANAKFGREKTRTVTIVSFSDTKNFENACIYTKEGFSGGAWSDTDQIILAMPCHITIPTLLTGQMLGLAQQYDGKSGGTQYLNVFHVTSPKIKKGPLLKMEKGKFEIIHDSLNDIVKESESFHINFKKHSKRFQASNRRP